MTAQTRTPRKRAPKPTPPEFTPGDENAPAGVTPSDESPQVEAAAPTSSSLPVADPSEPPPDGEYPWQSGAELVSNRPPDSSRTVPDSLPVPLGESPAPGTPAAAVIASQTPAQDDSGPTPVAAGTFAIYEDGGGGYVLVVLDPNGVESRKHIPGAIVRMATGGGLLGKSLGLGRLLGGMD